ncbi:MAG: hypothetical protein M1819_004525 [Sarea resinae]|nr:MAG: hypothetical protein M1819_004525 [Sarea resinae]
MPHFPRDMHPVDAGSSRPCESVGAVQDTITTEEAERRARIRVKNRRKHYLDTHPEYFSASLELAADPLLYDRLIRRYQSPSEREAEGRAKGYSGVLEADLMRSEAKLAALAHPSSSAVTYRRGPHGEILAEDRDEMPANKEEGLKRWRREMEMRFLRGEDLDFEYEDVDQNEEYDDRAEEQREEEDRYFGEEEPRWILGDDESGGDHGSSERQITGETGIQDF